MVVTVQNEADARREFGDLVYSRYVSRGTAVHAPLDDARVASFGAAYRWHLRGWLPAAKGAWLDVACGQGALLVLARDLGFARVEGVDGSEEMLASARRLGLRVTKDDARAFLERTEPASWNVVSFFDVVEHFPKPAALDLLRAARRALAPGGACFVKVPNEASPWGAGVTASDLTHETSFTPESLGALARLAGFEHVEHREVGPVPHGWKGRVRRALWGGLRAAYAAASVIETGSPGAGVYTRILLTRLS